MAIDFAQLVIRNLADEGSLQAQHRRAGQRVGGRAARDFLGRPHLGVEIDRPFGIDQPHRPRRQILVLQELVRDGGENVDDGVADGDHVVLGVGHVGSLSFALEISIGARPSDEASRGQGRLWCASN